MGISDKLGIMRQKELVNNDKVQTTKNFVERTGAIMGVQRGLDHVWSDPEP